MVLKDNIYISVSRLTHFDQINCQSFVLMNKKEIVEERKYKNFKSIVNFVIISNF